MCRAQRFAADVRRDQKTLRLRDRERPSVPRERHDVDALGRRAHTVPIKHVGERHASPALLGPPATGAVEDHVALGRWQGEQTVVVHRARRCDVSIDPDAPALQVDRRYRVERPDRERKRVRAERCRGA